MAQEIGLLVGRIKLNLEQIEQVIRKLREMVDCIPESQYILSINGLNYLTVAAVWAGLGPLSNYTNAKQCIKMIGTNPTEKESAGKSSSLTPMSKHGRSGLRGGLWNAVISLLRHNADFKSWVKARQERPANTNPLHIREAIGAAINRLLRLIFTLVKNRRIYQINQPELAQLAA